MISEAHPAEQNLQPKFRLFAILDAWNEGDVIGSTVANAFAEGCERVFLVDNGSHDDTVEQAEKVGATLARELRPDSLDEALHFRILKDVAREISEQGPDHHVWWLSLAGDEFPQAPAGLTVGEFLSSLDRRIRIVSARIFDHYPSTPPYFYPCRQPWRLQPYCEELTDSESLRRHKRYALQRIDLEEPPMACGAGNHAATAGVPLPEPSARIVLHRIPYRDPLVTRSRLYLACQLARHWTDRAIESGFQLSHLCTRYSLLDKVYEQGSNGFEKLQEELARRGARLTQWRDLDSESDIADARPAATAKIGSQILLSFCICTRDRRGPLQDALDSLLPQLQDRDDCELLVVDNGSRDGTNELLANYLSEFPTLRCITEPRIGLSHARNLAWRQSRGRWVGYLDDDVRVPSGWVEAAIDIAVRLAPPSFGGPYTARFNRRPPSWFRAEYASHFQGHSSRVLASHEFLDGLNFFIRRDLVAVLGGFDPALGVSGTSLGVGEETDLILRMRQAVPGIEIRYEPCLALEHLVHPHRTRLRWIARAMFVEGRYNYRLFESLRTPGAIPALAKLALNVVADAVFRAPFRDRSRYPALGSFIYEETMPKVRLMGSAYERLLASLGASNPSLAPKETRLQA